MGTAPVGLPQRGNLALRAVRSQLKPETCVNRDPLRAGVPTHLSGYLSAGLTAAHGAKMRNLSGASS
jgi:hypothetical protein